MSKPETATEMMMLSAEEKRIAARDRAVALSIASKAIAENFDADRIETLRDAEGMAVRAAEQAAYEAIRKERELHAGDMAMLKAWSEARWAENLLTMKPTFFTAQPIETRSDKTAQRA